MTAADFVQILRKNRVFRFTSSVKLAVPLMLVLGALVAGGTVVESNYNSDYAKLTIYNSGWFLALLGLLFLNIFNSTLSRYPFKKHHFGFVITHLGLLTLLTGSMMTSLWGIDGQLRVREGTSNATVVLPRLMLSYRMEGSPRPQSAIFERRLGELSGSSLSFINDAMGHVLRAERLLPFAAMEKTFVKGENESGAAALSFILKSQFFNVSEWLHSQTNPEMKMGPATLRLVVDDGTAPVARKPTTVTKIKAGGKDQVIIKDKSSGEVVSSWTVGKGDFQWKNLRLSVVQRFRSAIVAENKIKEGGGERDPNPALELEIRAGENSLREVLFAKFPSFSLNKDGVFGYLLEFKPAGEGAAELPQGHPPMHGTKAAAGDGPTVEFHVNPAKPTEARVELLKGGRTVGSSTLSEGQTIQTPWMGMTVSLGTLNWGSSESLEAKAVQPQKGKELPPPAIFLKPNGAETGFWLGEGEAKSFETNGRAAEVLFGRETLDLPFAIRLEKFTKVDYPGTETPMSFESDVDIGDGRGSRKISMNEPLKAQGYTIYQASYVMNGDGPPDSVFSVNWDPGRPVKYSGSLILALGIIIFTVTRSGWYKRRTA